MVGLDGPELFGGLLLRAVATVAEGCNVVRAGLAEVLTKSAYDGVARCLAVDQRLDLQRLRERAGAGIDPRDEVLVHLPDIIDAAAQFGNRRRIVVDADEQRVD